MSKDFGPVLVTGADTGIGRLTVETMAAKGYPTYAGVFDPSNIKELSALENVKSIQFDVTKPDDIRKVVDWIEDLGDGLYGVVNNAGISDLWPLIESPESYFHRVLNVNLYGVYRVTNAVVPFLQQTKGRIVTMGSLSGTIPSKMIGAYSVSKFAVEALTDIYNFELRKFGITAITIKPGNVQSNISNASAPILRKRQDDYEQSSYKEELAPLFDNLDNPAYLKRVQYDKPDRVVESIIDALYTENPKNKYLVANELDTKAAMKWMFRVTAQLNQHHTNSIDKVKLHQMLDEQVDKFT